MLENDLNAIFAKVDGEAGNSGQTPPNGNAYGWGNGNGNGGDSNGDGNGGGSNGGGNGTGGNTGGSTSGTSSNGTGVEKFVFYYHPDHLGSSSYITDVNGEVSQHIEYFAFGETFVEEHSNTGTTPYKFNAKELDDETGLYYYGARYYDPKTSVWASVDPLADYNPHMNNEHYVDGEHNLGVLFSGNNNPYTYCYQNPIIFFDPNGKQSKFWTRTWGGLQMVGGTVEAVVGGVGGIVTAETGVGAVVGYAVLMNGIDNATTGAKQLWTGESQTTLLHKGVKASSKALGASDSTAEKIAMGADISTIFLGGGSSIKALKSAYRTVIETSKAKSFFQGAKYTDKVLKQMENTSDLRHAFSKSVDAFAAKYGKWSEVVGGDGKTYQWLKMEGSITDKSGRTIKGVFEFTKDSKGMINHRYFKAHE